MSKNTSLGYRDISDDNFDNFRKYDVIRNARIISEKTENHNGTYEKIFHFKSDLPDIKGRIFPLDEIIFPNNFQDIIIQNSKITPSGEITFDCQVYHDLYNGEQLIVKAQKRPNNQDYSFKIFNHIGGFVKYAREKQIKPENVLLVEIYDLIGNGTKIHPLTKLIEIYENESKARESISSKICLQPTDSEKLINPGFNIIE